MLQFNVRSKEGIPYAYANNFFLWLTIWCYLRVQNRGSSLPSPQSFRLLQYLLSGTHLPLEQLNSAREQPVEEEPGASCKLTGLPGPKELEMELELDGKPAAPDPEPGAAPPPPPPPPPAAAAVAAMPKLIPRQRSSVSVAGSGCRRCWCCDCWCCCCNWCCCCCCCCCDWQWPLQLEVILDVAGVSVALIARHCVALVDTFSRILATFLCCSLGRHLLCLLSLHLVSLSLLVAFVVALWFGVVVAFAGAVFVANIRCLSFFGLFLLLYFWRHFNVITVVSAKKSRNARYT